MGGGSLAQWISRSNTWLARDRCLCSYHQAWHPLTLLPTPPGTTERLPPASRPSCYCHNLLIIPSITLSSSLSHYHLISTKRSLCHWSFETNIARQYLFRFYMCCKRFRGAVRGGGGSSNVRKGGAVVTCEDRDQEGLSARVRVMGTVRGQWVPPFPGSQYNKTRAIRCSNYTSLPLCFSRSVQN